MTITEDQVRFILSNFASAYHVCADGQHVARERVIQEATKSASRIIAEQTTLLSANADNPKNEN